jgi:RNA polymerase sigma-70 factor (ECF subfamily)
MVGVGKVIENVQLSDADLIQVYIDEYYKEVKKIATSYLGDCSMAEDIAQDVFIKVYNNLKSFKRKSDVFTWIYRITINHCRDYVKSANFRKVDLTESFILNRMVTQSDFTEEVVERINTIEKVSELPVKFKEVIILYYYNQLTTREIAKTLRIRESTVRTRLTRARQMLETQLKIDGR